MCDEKIWMWLDLTPDMNWILIYVVNVDRAELIPVDLPQIEPDRRRPWRYWHPWW